MVYFWSRKRGRPDLRSPSLRTILVLLRSNLEWENRRDKRDTDVKRGRTALNRAYGLAVRLRRKLPY